MNSERIFLRENDNSVYLNVYLSKGKKPISDALLIIPGGGYSVVCGEREGKAIAYDFCRRDFTCFELYYSIGDKSVYPRPLIDACLAMKHIKDNAEKYNINPERVFACGFSAGGHLCGMLATMWHRKEIYEEIPDMPFGYPKPRGVLLCYAVQNTLHYCHKSTIMNITGNDFSPEKLRYLSINENIDSRSCPAFFMHTAADTLVPVENTLLSALAYSLEKIPFEVHIYPFGPHGIALASKETAGNDQNFIDACVSNWTKQAADWMKRI